MIEAHLFRDTGNRLEFLLLKRAEKEIYPGLWQMVSGKIKSGETAYAAALREINEETGLIPEKLWVAPKVNSFYSHEKDTITLVPVFAALISIDSGVQISDEHSAYGWYTIEDAEELLAWPGQREAIRIINDYFSSRMSFLNFTEIKL